MYRVDCSRYAARRPHSRTLVRMLDACSQARWVPPSSEQNTNRVVVGTMASNGLHSRKAAQSARKAANTRAAPAASRKPSSAGAGAETSWNVVHAWRRASAAASRVDGVGSPTSVVSANSSHDSTSAPAPMTTRADRGTDQARRRHPAAARWATSPTASSGPRKPPSSTRTKPTITAPVTRARATSASTSSGELTTSRSPSRLMGAVWRAGPSGPRRPGPRRWPPAPAGPCAARRGHPPGRSRSTGRACWT